MISVVVPAYNAEKYLNTCISSIQAQTVKDLEIVVVNDGSTDKSLQLANAIKETDARVRVVDQQNSGVSAARNAGVRAATGEYLAFVDADDYIAPHMYETMLAALRRSGSDLVICGYRNIQGEKVTEVCVDTIRTLQIQTHPPQLVELYDQKHLNSVCTKLYKRALITRGFDEDIGIGEDLLFNLDYLQNINTVTCIPDVLYNYPSNPKSAMNRYQPEFFPITKRLYRKTLDRFDSLGMDMAIDHVQARFLGDVFNAIQRIYEHPRRDAAGPWGNLGAIARDEDVKIVCGRPLPVPRQHALVQRWLHRGNLCGIHVFFLLKGAAKKVLGVYR